MILHVLKKLKKKRAYNLGLHIFFWIFFFFVPHILFGLPYSKEFLLVRFVEICILLVVFYINAYFLVPKLLAKRKYILYFFIVLFSIYSIMQFGDLAKKNIPPAVIERIHEHISTHCDVSEGNQENVCNNPRPAFIGIIVLMSFALSIAYGYARINVLREKQMKFLEKEQMTSELLFLKSQINPHFLFNVLNSIYSLSLKKSDDLPDVVLRLSDLLRYMTYDSEDKLVAIEKEVSYIQSYIELQKIRLQKESIVNLHVDNQYSNTQIAPLILIAFIENAFKHGILSNSLTVIDINILINSENIDLTVVNEFSVSSQKDKFSGIGIQNVKRRLEIMYPNRHILEIREEKNQHIVNLRITHG